MRDINGNVDYRAHEIQVLAREEIKAEDKRAAIDAEKQRIREDRTRARWWHRVVPFTIKIERR